MLCICVSIYIYMGIYIGIGYRLYSIFFSSMLLHLQQSWRGDGPLFAGEEVAVQSGPLACPVSHGCTCCNWGWTQRLLVPSTPPTQSHLICSRSPIIVSLSNTISWGGWQEFWQFPSDLGVSGFFLNPCFLCHSMGSSPLGMGQSINASLMVNLGAV